MSKALAIIRCEASSKIGAGHAMRCSVLAKLLAEHNWDCYFATSEETFSFIPKLKEFQRIEPEQLSQDKIIHDLLVVDHYELDFEFEQAHRNLAAKILVIDDLANRKHDCDILLDQTFGRKSDDYINMVPTSCRIFAGSQFALLRPAFAALREKALLKRESTKEIKRLLINMGGADQHNFTTVVLKEIQKFGFKGDIDIILGFAAPHKNAVLEQIEKMDSNCVTHTDADMPSLMYEADVAFGAAGSSVWERACLGLPTILMLTADNQQFSYNQLINNGLCIPINEMSTIFNVGNYKQHYQKVAKICDGLGAQRIFNEILRKGITYEMQEKNY